MVQLLSKMSELAPSVRRYKCQVKWKEQGQMERTRDSVTEWCICGKCREMPVEMENLCCINHEILQTIRRYPLKRNPSCNCIKFMF